MNATGTLVQALADDSLFFTIDDTEYVNEELALAVLLIDGCVFTNHREYGWGGKVDGQTTVVFVICNDIFSWGTADAEALDHDEIGPLLKMHLADPRWGVAKWCMKQRNQRPQGPVERDMRAAGAWDEMCEALPLNTQDAEAHALMAGLN